MNKIDTQILTRGLKRMLLALLTGAMFTLSVWGLIEVAFAPGYLAVLLFFASVTIFGGALLLLYAQGITRVESQGENE